MVGALLAGVGGALLAGVGGALLAGVGGSLMAGVGGGCDSQSRESSVHDKRSSSIKSKGSENPVRYDMLRGAGQLGECHFATRGDEHRPSRANGKCPTFLPKLFWGKIFFGGTFGGTFYPNNFDPSPVNVSRNEPCHFHFTMPVVASNSVFSVDQKSGGTGFARKREVMTVRVPPSLFPEMPPRGWSGDVKDNGPLSLDPGSCSMWDWTVTL